METFKEFITEKVFKVSGIRKGEKIWISIGSNNLKTAIKELKKIAGNTKSTSKYNHEQGLYYKNQTEFRIVNDLNEDKFYVWFAIDSDHWTVILHYKLQDISREEGFAFNDTKEVNIYNTKNTDFFKGYKIF